MHLTKFEVSFILTFIFLIFHIFSSKTLAQLDSSRFLALFTFYLKILQIQRVRCTYSSTNSKQHENPGRFVNLKNKKQSKHHAQKILTCRSLLHSLNEFFRAAGHIISLDETLVDKNYN